MTVSEISAYVLQLLLSAALIARVGIVHQRTKLSSAIDLLLAAAYLAAIAFAAPWLALPWQLPWILGSLLVVAALWGGRRAGTTAGDSRSRWQLLGVGIRGLLIVAFTGIAAVELSGHQRFGAPALDLASPLQGSTYLIANGGTSELINPHLKTLEGERFRSYRGQSYALDIVAVGAWGSRSSGNSGRSDEPHLHLHAQTPGTEAAPLGGEPVPITIDGRHLARNDRMGRR